MSRELERLRTPVADNIIDTFLRDVIGSKSDATAVGVVTTTDTLVAYTKQIVGDVISILENTGTAGVVLGADAITAAKIADAAFSNEHFDPDASRKLILGTVIDKSAATLPQTTSVALFEITGGKILITSIVGEVTVVIQNQANATKLTSVPDTGTAADMCGTLDISAHEVGSLYGITGTPADNMVTGNAGLTIGMSNKGIVVNSGTINLNCAANNTGEIKWTMHYVPIDSSATVDMVLT